MRSTWLLMCAALACAPVAHAADYGVPVVASPAGPGCGACAAPAAPCTGWIPGHGLFTRKGYGQGPACVHPSGGCATAAPVKATACAPACAPAKASCNTCTQPKAATCGTGCGHGGRFSRLKAWFGYHDCGACPTDCHSCKSGCHTPLFLMFLRDCAYRPSHCAHSMGGAEGAVNPPYSRGVFPTGHMIGAQPAGIAGPCCNGR